MKVQLMEKGISNHLDDFDGDPTSIKKVLNKPQQPPVNQSVSMIADDGIEILHRTIKHNLTFFDLSHFFREPNPAIKFNL